MVNILLAVDGSESSDKAVEKVAEVASSPTVEITLLTIIEDINIPKKNSPPTPKQTTNKQQHSSQQSAPSPRKIKKIRKQREKQRRLEAEGETILNEAEKILNEETLEAKKVMLKGNASDKICEYAEKKESDLIVLADRGRGGIKKMLLGSTSEKVLRNANTPVLVIK